MHLLVTGSDGLLGADLCRSLDAAGFEVVATSRRAVNPPPGIKTLTADLSNSDEVNKLFEGNNYDAVIHCAAVIKGNSHDDYYLNNVRATDNLAQCARKNGVSKFLFMSTISVYVDQGPFCETSELASTGDYAISKIISEHSLQLLASENFKVIVLRLAGLHGALRKNGVFYSMREAAAMGKPLLVSSPASVVSLTFLEDTNIAINELLNLVWEFPWSVYNFANSEPKTLAELANIIVNKMPTRSLIEAGTAQTHNRNLIVNKLRNDYGISLMPTKERIESFLVDGYNQPI
jgi:nucleoside-diphosphate-sugar epimerase